MAGPRDPHLLDRQKQQKNTETEFSWGKGLAAPGREVSPPSQGGIYRGLSPDQTVPPKPIRRGDPPQGYPGDRIAP